METGGSEAAATALSEIETTRVKVAERLIYNATRANLVAAGMALSVATIPFVDGHWTGIPVAAFAVLLPALVAVPRRRGVVPWISRRIIGTIFICCSLLLGLLTAGMVGAWLGYPVVTFAAAAMVWIFGVAVNRLLHNAYQNAVRSPDTPVDRLPSTRR